VTAILLIRHGDTDAVHNYIAGRDTTLLNERGIKQADELVTRLADQPISAIYTSPLPRTMQTATPLAHARSLQLHLSPEMLEVDFGEWTARTFESLAEDPRWKLWNAYRSGSRTPGGESMVEVQRRAADFLAALHQRHRDQTIAVFSHGDVIRAALAHYLGVHLDLFLRIDVSPASVSLVDVSDWGPVVRWMNVT
jgi:probable phosphoglycerate mutase